MVCCLHDEAYSHQLKRHVLLTMEPFSAGCEDPAPAVNGCVAVAKHDILHAIAMFDSVVCIVRQGLYPAR